MLFILLVIQVNSDIYCTTAISSINYSSQKHERKYIKYPTRKTNTLKRNNKILHQVTDSTNNGAVAEIKMVSMMTMTTTTTAMMMMMTIIIIIIIIIMCSGQFMIQIKNSVVLVIGMHLIKSLIHAGYLCEKWNFSTHNNRKIASTLKTGRKILLSGSEIIINQEGVWRMRIPAKRILKSLYERKNLRTTERIVVKYNMA
jgi:hypothetical protein